MVRTADHRRRVIEFEGAKNFRDLGGYPSRFGGSVRWGCLYRAAALHEMTSADLGRYDQLGIGTVYDLRSEMEYADHPDPVPSISVPLLGRFMSEHERPDFASMVSHDDGAAFMQGMLWNVITWGAAEVGAVITGLAAESSLPAVFHCTAGKDRTGVLAALLLEALGVDREHVLDDFVHSDGHFSSDDMSAAFERMSSMGMPPEAAAGALGAPRGMLAAVLGQVDDEFGGVEPYLRDRAGVSQSTIVRLRHLLLA